MPGSTRRRSCTSCRVRSRNGPRTWTRCSWSARTAGCNATHFGVTRQGRSAPLPHTPSRHRCGECVRVHWYNTSERSGWAENGMGLRSMRRMQSGTGQLVHLHLHIQLGEVNRERVGRPWAQDETSNFLVACLEAGPCTRSLLSST